MFFVIARESKSIPFDRCFGCQGVGDRGRKIALYPRKKHLLPQGSALNLNGYLKPGGGRWNRSLEQLAVPAGGGN